MKQSHTLHQAIALFIMASGCTTANPNHRVCIESQPLRCEDGILVTCSDDGTAEVDQACPLGCSAAQPKCLGPIPSNGLAGHLELSSNRAGLDLGESATINTDTGEVTVAGAQVAIDSDTLDQTNAPAIRVFVAGNFVAKDVVVTGKNAVAIVSDSDIAISGTFTVSAKGDSRGPGEFGDEGCMGKLPPSAKVGGAGGGGFGSVGAPGGLGTDANTAEAGLGGSETGTATLTPLRGGCRGGGVAPNQIAGAGGGAVQLVARRQMVVNGIVAANGGGWFGGGGSGGGILLEAPIIAVSGSVVANGGGGGMGASEGCTQGQDGRFDAKPAAGGSCGTKPGGLSGRGGTGAARDVNATPGSGRFVRYGHGGGGAGRIRANTAPGGFRNAGIFSPSPSLGALATP